MSHLLPSAFAKPMARWWLALALAGALAAGCDEPGAPVVESVEPTRAPADTLVTVIGRNLAGITAMTFDGQVVNFNTAYNADEALLFRVPPSVAPGEYEVALTTDGGRATFPFAVTLGAPLVLRFSNDQGAAGSVTTIYGENFFEPLEVYFVGEEDSLRAEILAASEDSIRVRVPDEATRGYVYVQANGGESRSPGRFEVLLETLVADFDGGGARPDVGAWIFRGGLELTGADAVRGDGPEPLDGDYLTLRGTAGTSPLIGNVRTPSAGLDVFGLEAEGRFTFLEFDYNTDGHPATQLTVVLKERDGSLNDFSRSFDLDEDGWVSVSQPLTRFQDLDGVPADPAKVVYVKFILLDEAGSGEPFEANIDNLRFVQLP